jgi:hypothetical protein
MPIYPDEVIPPHGEAGPERRPIQVGLSDEFLAGLAGLLDDAFQIPGTGIRFGLDPVIGLVPGIGDVLTGLASFLIVFTAWQRGLPKVTQARMMVNIFIDTLLGAIPIVGDAFDVAWKSNRMNFELLQRAQTTSRTRQTVFDWLFLFGVAALAAILVALPFIIVYFIVRSIRG